MSSCHSLHTPLVLMPFLPRLSPSPSPSLHCVPLQAFLQQHHRTEGDDEGLPLVRHLEERRRQVRTGELQAVVLDKVQQSGDAEAKGVAGFLEDLLFHHLV